MQALHTHPKRPKEYADYIKDIFHDNLYHPEGLVLAEVKWEEKAFASVYLHKIHSIISANTNYIKERDTYAVIVDGAVLMAYNIGGYPWEGIYLFDRLHYDNLTEKMDKFDYVAYTCLGGPGLPPDFLLHVYDHTTKKRLDEISLPDEVES